MTTAKKSKSKINKNNSTGYHGVTRNKAGKYVAQINHARKTTRIGVFSTAIAAALAYDEIAPSIHGEKAKLNFPPKSDK